ncbi:MAG: hypothetical protein GX622_04315 [Bacteroidales bacterium]|nr:hypothetical protein [Bacteroidales bacterium]
MKANVLPFLLKQASCAFLYLAEACVNAPFDPVVNPVGSLVFDDLFGPDYLHQWADRTK